MTKWPSKKQLEKALEEIDASPSSRPLPDDASPVDRTKHAICTQLLIYMRSHRLSQQGLAEKLEIDKSLVSKIAHFNYGDFTIDRLIKYLAVIDPHLTIEIKARVA